MLDSQTSLRLNLLRFPLIVFVVFIHANKNTVELIGGNIGVSQPDLVVDFIRNFISEGLARTAVPLFFIMSGYLFFFEFLWSKENFLKKLKSRAKTLILPFLFWNVLMLLSTAIAQASPLVTILRSGKGPLIANFNLFDYFNSITGFASVYPIAYQFWFIRDLIILILFTPLINIINKFAALPFLVFLFCLWIGTWPFNIPSPEALLFFCVGSYLGSNNKNLFYFDNFGKIICFLYVVIVIVDVLTIKLAFNPYLHKIGIILGVVVVLFFTRFISLNEKLKSSLLLLSGTSFFVYAVHEPLLTVLRKIFFKIIIPESSFAILFIYFLSPVVTIILAIVSCRILAIIAPNFLKIVTGSR